MKKWKPIFIENSKIPVWLSYFAPIEINAISIGIFVWCRSTMSAITKRHETIHFQQQLELLFLPFYLLYILAWFHGLWKYRNAVTAYRESVFEREAFSNDCTEGYLETRSRYAWVKHWSDDKDSYKERVKRVLRDRVVRKESEL
jgi:hypothetical protein